GRERPVEGPTNEWQPGCKFLRETSGGQFSIETKGIDAFERPEAMLRKCCGPDRLSTQASGRRMSAGKYELDGVPSFAERDVLTLAGSQQDCRPT
ncbi:hypothetical protein, partial [Mesorhizobium sp. M5C.F.Ca.IN.020.32.2.1]|uniref:hypothetical protein n=1 Tax=Mesorhizobium sp. M5C.F.Ca.IN.020.32.2.1 TaxID=2496771 RepID=UPI0019D4BF62